MKKWLFILSALLWAFLPSHASVYQLHENIPDDRYSIYEHDVEEDDIDFGYLYDLEEDYEQDEGSEVVITTWGDLIWFIVKSSFMGLLLAVIFFFTPIGIIIISVFTIKGSEFLQSYILICFPVFLFLLISGISAYTERDKIIAFWNTNLDNPPPYWISSKSGTTHNWGCRYYEEIKGYHSYKPSGKNCPICDGCRH